MHFVHPLPYISNYQYLFDDYSLDKVLGKLIKEYGESDETFEKYIDIIDEKTRKIEIDSNIDINLIINSKIKPSTFIV